MGFVISVAELVGFSDTVVLLPFDDVIFGNSSKTRSIGLDLSYTILDIEFNDLRNILTLNISIT
jgi:hypothetical protein